MLPRRLHRQNRQAPLVTAFPAFPLAMALAFTLALAVGPGASPARASGPYQDVSAARVIASQGYHSRGHRSRGHRSRGSGYVIAPAQGRISYGRISHDRVSYGQASLGGALTYLFGGRVYRPSHIFQAPRYGREYRHRRGPVGHRPLFSYGPFSYGPVSYRRVSHRRISHRRVSYRRGSNRAACRAVTKLGTDGYGRAARIGGTLCYDAYGTAYIVRGSRHVVDDDD